MISGNFFESVYDQSSNKSIGLGGMNERHDAASGTDGRVISR
jgi:hypothetical protein